MKSVTEISNVNSVVSDLSPGLDLGAALLASGVVETIPDTAMGTAVANAKPRKGKGKTHKPVVPVVPAGDVTVLPQAQTMADVGPVKVPEGAPVTFNLPADAAIQTGIADLANAMVAATYASSNVWIALAHFGEASGLAGNRPTAEAALRMIASDPDRFIPAGVSPNIKARIVKLCDKSAANSEFSRAASAIAAGSVLLHWLQKARELFDANPAATGWSRVVQRLTSASMANARTAIGKPVDASWDGEMVKAPCLPTILAAAADTEEKAQEGTTLARQNGASQGPGTGSAGRVAGNPPPVNPALVPANAQIAGDKATGKPTVPPVSGTPVPPPVVGSVSQLGIQPKPHVGKVQSVENVARSIPGDAPDEIRAGVQAQVDLILAAVDAIRGLFNSAANKSAVVPSAGLTILTGFEGFKIG